MKTGLRQRESEFMHTACMMVWGGSLFKAKAVNEVDDGGGSRGGGGREKGASDNSTLY
jgi:hypothetical protein